MKEDKNIENIISDMESLFGDDSTSQLDSICSWRDKNTCAKTVLEHLTEEKTLEAKIAEYKDIESIREEKVELLKKSIKQQKLQRRRQLTKSLITASAVAAAMIVVSFYVFNTVKPSTSELTPTFHAEDIVKPTLVVNNSNITIQLKEISVDNLIDDANLKAEEMSAPQEKKLIVPHRAVQVITLSDGSKVTVNANSELIIAADYGVSSRVVELNGEAYFEVEKSDIPFIVKANGAFTRVYGTQFNVNTLKDKLTETVLIEGSVGVGICEGNNQYESSLTIEPNTLAAVNATSGEINSRTVETFEYTQWMGSYFNFIDCPFSQVIQGLENWYGVDIEYDEQSFTDIRLSMSSLKDKDLIETMQFMKKIINIVIHFTPEGTCLVELNNERRDKAKK